MTIVADQGFIPENLNDEKMAFFHNAGYIPSPGQEQFHLSLARYRILVAGSRFGKSMAGGYEAAFELMIPGRQIWIVATNYDLAKKEFGWAMNALSSIQYGDSKIIDLCDYHDGDRGPKYIKTPWDSWLYTKSTEERTLLLGEELDLLILGEGSQIPFEAYDRYLRRALISRKGRLICPSTPNSDAGLLMHFWKQVQEKKPGWAGWQFRSVDSGHLSEEEWKSMKEDMTEENFAEQGEGKFVSRRGKVFRFGDDHVFKKPPEGMEHWPVLMGVRMNFKNPFAILFIAINREERTYWVYDEIYLTEKLPSEIAPLMIQKQKGRHIIGRITEYGDGAKIIEMRKAGIDCTPIDEKAFSKSQATIRRIQAVQNCLKVRPEKGPRLRVSADCVNTIKDLESCTWPDKREDKEEIELPLTKHLHAPLALSYVLAYCEALWGINIYAATETAAARG